jgi:hypothetical protein
LDLAESSVVKHVFVVGVENKPASRLSFPRDSDERQVFWRNGIPWL